MACRLPGAADEAAFWGQLVRGAASIREIPADRWSIAEVYDPDLGTPGKTNCKWGGFLEHIDRFDHRFFSISPREARSMDPQQRLLLEEAWHCIEDAAVPLVELQRARTAVYVGVMAIDYHQNATASDEPVDSYACLGNYGGILANRLSHVFGLRGVSQTIDCACASSLAALHQARRALLAGECDFALVGAASLIVNPWKYISFSRSRMLSATGACKTFDRDADGYVPGEGVAVVLLQRADAARRAGHRCHGLVLGSAQNHVGASRTITAPSVASQRELVLAALREAGVEADTISYVEAHGTGTSLGDPIEVEALTQAFRTQTARRGFCRIGSVKTNIGHLEAASGLAGVVKVLLMMRHGQVPATLNIRTPNPLIDFSAGPFVPASTRCAWDERPRRAGVSSFGFGGANAHVVLAEPDRVEAPPAPPEGAPRPFLLSAKSATSLAGLLERWRAFVAAPEFAGASLWDVCGTLMVGRAAFDHRVGGVVHTRADVARVLDGPVRAVSPTNRPTVVLRVGPGPAYDHAAWQRFCRGCEPVRRLHDAASAELGDGDLARRFLGLYVLGAHLLGCGLRPGLVIGEGLGRWVSLALTGVLELGDAWRAATGEVGAVRLRRPRVPLFDGAAAEVLSPSAIGAAYLQEVRAGLRASPDEVLGLLELGRALARSQFTFKQALEEWQFTLGAAGDVSAWLAAPPTEPAQQRLLLLVLVCCCRKLDEKWELSRPSPLRDPAWEEASRLVCGGIMTPAEAARCFGGEPVDVHALAAVMRGRHVQRGLSLRLPLLEGRDDALPEVGAPAEWLRASAAAAPEPALAVDAVVCVVGGARAGALEFSSGAPAVAEVQARLVELWMAGVDLDWSAVAGTFARVSLPGYVFERHRSWIDLRRAPAGASEAAPGRTTLALADPGLIAEHRVDGRPVAPGALLLVAVLEAAQQRRTPAPRLVEVVFHRPLVGEPREVSVALDVDAGEFAVRTGPALLCAGRLAGPGEACAAAPAEVSFETGACVAGAALYAELRGLGYDYGPRLRLLARGWPGDGSFVLEAPTTGSAGAVEAAVIDATLQAMLLAGLYAGVRADAPLVPWRIEAVERTGPLPRSGRVSVTAVRREPGGVCADAQLCDAAGVVALRMTGCHFRPVRAAHPAVSAASGEPGAGDDGPALYELPWRPVPSAPAGPARAWILSDRGGVAAGLARVLAGEVVVHAPELRERFDGEALARALAGPAAPQRIYVLWGLDVSHVAPDAAGVAAAEATLIGPGLGLFGALVAGATRPVEVVVVTRGLHAITATQPPCSPLAAALVGLGKCAGRESSHVRVVAFDLPGEVDAASLRALAEVAVDCPLGEVAWRDGQRWVRVLERARAVPTVRSPLREGGVYLICGGAGGLGRVLGRHLVAHVRARLVLVGRRAPDPPLDAALAALRAGGGEAMYVQADVGDLESMRRVVAAVRARFGRIHGVVHAALELADGPLREMSAAAFAAAASVKLRGSAVLWEVTRDEPLDLWWCFSSALTARGNAGQANYLAGCAFQDALAPWLAARGVPAKAVLWGPWGESGRVAQPRFVPLLRRQGLIPLRDDEGVALLAELLVDPRPHVIAARFVPGLVADPEVATRGGPGLDASGGDGQTDSPGGALAAFASGDLGGALAGFAVDGLEPALAALDALARGLWLRSLQQEGLWRAAGVVHARGELRRVCRPLPRHERLLWTLVEGLERGGLLRPTDGGWVAERTVEDLDRTLADLRAGLQRRHPGFATVVRLVDACAPRGLEVVRGDVPATDVLFPGGAMDVVEGFYRGNPLADSHNAVTAAAVGMVVDAARAAGRRVRVLELGAGTGSTTEAVLRRLERHADAVEYVYTDISPAFLAYGRRRFAERGHVRFASLDLERPAADSDGLGLFDVVVATNVLHATRRMAAALGHVAARLRPSGALVVNELTQPRDFLSASFGLLDGWWRFEDDRPHAAPLLGVAQWARLLGPPLFSHVRARTAAPSDGPWVQSVFVALRAEEAPGVHTSGVGESSAGLPVADAGASRPAEQGGPGSALASEAALRASPATRPPTTSSTSGSALASEAALREALRVVVAAALQMAPVGLDVEQRFSELGVDSIVAGELARSVGRLVGQPLGAAILYDHASVARLARHLWRRHGAAPAAGVAAGGDPPRVRGSAGAVDPAVVAAGGDPPRVRGSAGAVDPAVDAAGVAIIGMSGRFPGAADLREFWRVVRGGVDAVGEAPAGRWSPEEFAAFGAEDRPIYRQGGFLDDADRFDPLAFGVSPREAELMDPQQRVALEEIWRALDDAGLGEARPDRVGVFVGASAGDYADKRTALRLPIDGLSLSANLPSTLAARLAYCFDLRGPTMTVDTACASSLTALHLACTSLRQGECEVAVVVGVAVLSTPQMAIWAERAGILAARGRCRAFAPDADGLVLAEGVGVVVLRRWSAAEEAGDRIYAVVQATGVGQNGATNGLTAPAAGPQAELATEVIRRSRIAAREVGVIEAHGTGTRIGDDIEVAGLTATFAAASGRPEPISVGSVKSNFGHALAASGMASLFKVVLQMMHGELVPTLHVADGCVVAGPPGPTLRAQTRVEPWPPGKRVGVINSFALNGSTAFAVVVGAPAPVVAGGPVPACGLLLALSAHTLPALARWVAALRDWLAGPAVDLASLVRTVNTGRRALPIRAAFVVRDVDDARAQLAAWSPGPHQAGQGEPEIRAVFAAVGTRLLGEAMAEADPALGRAKLCAAAELYVAGHSLDLSVQTSRSGRRIPLTPGYPFARDRYWPGGAAEVPAAVLPGGGVVAAPADRAGRRERLVAAMRATAAAVLRLSPEQVDPAQPLARLGLESILALELRGRLRHELGVDVSTGELLGAGTLEGWVTGALARDPELDVSSAGEPVLAASDPRGRFEAFPLTDLQTAYWLGRDERHALGGNGCHLYWELTGDDWDDERLGAAWRRLIAAHDALRLIVLADGTQRVLAEVPAYAIEVRDWRALGPSAAAEQLAAVRAEMSHEVFEPGRWPLFRVVVSRQRDRSRIHFSLDLLVADARSIVRLLGQWGELYGDPSARVEAPAASFRDHVLALERHRSGAAYAAALAYWGRLAPTLPPAPELPLGRPLEAIGRPRYERHHAELDAGPWAAIQERAGAAGLTAVNVVLTAFAEVLGRWSRGSRFTLNLTVAHRLPVHPEIDAVIGDFSSTILLDVDGGGRAPFHERALAIKQRLTERLDHCVVSGVHVLRTLSRASGGSPARMPVVFTSMLGHTRAGAPMTALGRVTWGVSQTPQVYLDCQVREEEGRLVVDWDVACGLFEDGVVAAMFAAFVGLLRELADDPAAWGRAVHALLPADQRRARAQVNATAAPLADVRLHELFMRRAEAAPERVALVSARRTLTYGELDARARGVAALLGPRRGELIAVALAKGWEQVPAVVGVHMTGGAYLPIEPGLPAERFDELLRRGGVRTAVSSRGLALRWPSEVRVVYIEDARPDAAARTVAGDPGDLAYVMFTSGSTGVPKGVAIDHRGAVNTLLDINERFTVQATDRVLALSSLGFDLSVYDIFGTLAAGAAIVVPEPDSVRDPAHLGAVVREHGVTIWNSVPMFLQLLLDGEGERVGRTLASVRLALLSGDWIPLGLPPRVWAASPTTQVVSLGGATEASIWSIVHPITGLLPGWSSIPYGRPLANQRFHVLGPDLADRPDWVTGQLYIAGAGLARGYHGEPGRTAERFIRHPDTGERMYDTGDLGRYRPGGLLEFLGREDGQVKVDGYRVELGEIEAALASHPAVEGAVAGVCGAAGGRVRLLAGVVISPGHTLTPTDARAFLTGKLPAYMVPARLEVLARLPLTANGKVDRRAFVASATAAVQPPADPGASRPAGARASAPSGRATRRPPGPEFLDDPDVLTAPDGRAAFVRARVGVRGDLADRPRQRLADTPSRGLPERRTRREFLAEPVGLAALTDVLAALRGRERDGAVRYGYASAGAAYPVQVYVHVEPGRVDGVAGGIYYHHPLEHSLVTLVPGAKLPVEVHYPANRAIAAAAAFSLLMVAKLSAIVPLYGALGHELALVEAGYMGQALMLAAAGRGLGLCPIGGLDGDRVLRLLGVDDDDHVLVHAMVGGAVREPAGVPDRPAEPPVEAASDGRGSRRWTWESDGADAAGGGAGVEATAGPCAPGIDAQADATELEAACCRLWCEVLGIGAVDRDETFVAVGGDSFSAVEVSRRINSELGRRCTVTDIFMYPTVRALAGFLANRGADGAPADDGAAAAPSAGDAGGRAVTAWEGADEPSNDGARRTRRRLFRAGLAADKEGSG